MSGPGAAARAGLGGALAAGVGQPLRGVRTGFHFDPIDELPQGQEAVDGALAVALAADDEVAELELDAVGGLVDLLPALPAAPDELLLDPARIDSEAGHPLLEILQLGGNDAQVGRDVHGQSMTLPAPRFKLQAPRRRYYEKSGRLEGIHFQILVLHPGSKLEGRSAKR